MTKSWANFWVLRSGERIRASKEYELEPGIFRIAQSFDAVGSNNPNIPKLKSQECDDAYDQSWSATSRLFDWHGHYDDELWLDDENSKIEHFKRLQNHPWIVGPFHNADEFDALEDNQCSPDLSRVLNWNIDSLKHCHPAIQADFS